MLDAFIIEQIRRREEDAERRRNSIQPSIPLPLPPHIYDRDSNETTRKNPDEDDDNNGICIIDMKSFYQHQS